MTEEARLVGRACPFCHSVHIEPELSPEMLALVRQEVSPKPMSATELLERFRAMVEAAQRVRLRQQHPAMIEEIVTASASTHVHLGRTFARVDVGDSGKYMVDLATGDIFGIKGYGVVHRGHPYGTLETIDRYEWGEFHAHRKPEEVHHEDVHA